MMTSNYPPPPPLYLQPTNSFSRSSASQAAGSSYDPSSMTSASNTSIGSSYYGHTMQDSNAYSKSGLSPHSAGLGAPSHATSNHSSSNSETQSTPSPSSISGAQSSGAQSNRSQQQVYHDATYSTSSNSQYDVASQYQGQHQNPDGSGSEDQELNTLNGADEESYSHSFYDPFRVKHRRRTTPGQLKTLEYHFEHNPKPDVNLRKALAEQLEMTPREVQVWFQNRRAKVKKLREKAEKEGIDPDTVGIARDTGDSSPPDTTGHSYRTSASLAQQGLYHLPTAGSLAPNSIDYSANEYSEYETTHRRGSVATNHSNSLSPPNSYYDSSSAASQAGVLYPSQMYQSAAGAYGGSIPSGYPTPTSMVTPSQSPLDGLRPDGTIDTSYSSGGRRFSLPAPSYGAIDANGYAPTSWDEHAASIRAYATPPIETSSANGAMYRDYDYLNGQAAVDTDSPQDPTDAYSFTSHNQPSTTSFHQYSVDANGNLSQASDTTSVQAHVVDRRPSFPNLNQAFDTLTFAGSSASISTAATSVAPASPTRIGGSAAPQWPRGGNSYAAPAFAPTSSAPVSEFIYGSSPIATPPVNYFPIINRVGAAANPGGRRGSLHSIPERGNFIDPSVTLSSPMNSTSAIDTSSWAPTNSGAPIERRGSASSNVARRMRSNASLRAPAPYSTNSSDRPNRSPTNQNALVGVDSRVVPDGLQYVLPSSSTGSNSTISAPVVSDSPQDFTAMVN